MTMPAGWSEPEREAGPGLSGWSSRGPDDIDECVILWDDDTVQTDYCTAPLAVILALVAHREANREA